MLKPLLPDFAAASSVLVTGLENLNLIVHPAMVLPNIGMIERAKIEGRKMRLLPGRCGACGGRARRCARRRAQARVRGLWRRAHADGEGDRAVLRLQEQHVLRGDAESRLQIVSRPSCRMSGAPGSATTCPTPSCRACSLGEQAGIAAPLHRAFAEVFGTLLAVDPWTCGPSLADMDLQGTPEAVKKRVLGST